MPRYHVHLTVTDYRWAERDPVIAVTVDAADDDTAQLTAIAMLGDLVCDVCEIELAEPARDFMSQVLNEGDGVYRP